MDIQYLINQLGNTREQVIANLGEPNDKSCGSRKYPIPAIYKYGIYEIHFAPWKSGTAWLIFDALNHKTLAKS